MNKVAHWYSRASRGKKSLAQSMLSFVLFYGGAVLENQVQVVSEGGLWPKGLGHVAFVAMIVVGIGVLRFYLSGVTERIEEDQRQKKETIQYASSLMEQAISEEAHAMHEALASNQVTKNDFVGCFGSQGRLQSIVKKAYQLFESRYGQSERIDDRTSFEVTFMTKSYKDDRITIPAYANRDGRAPISLSKRHGNSSVYERTVTAELYRDEKPRMRIITDTNDDCSYKEIYPEQKKRICSTVVWPVPGPDNAMLGALVVHCDQPGFFKEADRKFWEQLMEIFGKRIALERLRLDILNRGGIQRDWGVQLQAPY